MSSVTFAPSVGGDGSTVTDDSNATTGLDGGGHRTRFVPALAQVVAVAANTVTKAGEASASAGVAASSASSAAAQVGLTTAAGAAQVALATAHVATASSQATASATSASQAAASASQATASASQAAASAAQAAAHSHVIADVTGLQTAIDGKEPTIAAGTTAQFWQGDKTWQDLFTRVRAATLTGLSTTTNEAIAAADTVLVAFGKLQAQLDGVASGATNYTHPANHPPSIITQDESNRFVTDTEKATWNAKGDVTLTGTQTLTNKTLTTPLVTGLRETRTAMGANAIDLATGNFFSKTISGATTFTVSNVPATGTAATFILDLTNGGSAAITWFAGVKWAGGTAPTLTAAGRDVLGFFTHDGGTTWTGLLMGKDVR